MVAPVPLDRAHDGSRAGDPFPAADAPARRYRPELQGLRALAVVLVVVYHVWVDRVSVGVDVFFVLTGFLLTGQLLRAAERGPIALAPLCSRILTRLLPAAIAVLVGTVVASAFLLPESRWFATIREVLAAALFLENWALVADSVDYTAQNSSASVVQHFWSLSIQGQFFLVWPLLVALVARSAQASLRPYLLLTSLAVLFASLTYSITLTAADQAFAYFHSLTRLWEFALGAALALVIDRIVLPRGVAVLVGWTGVVGLVACGMVLQVSDVFPGWVALWPTGCAVLVLAAGATGSPLGVDRLLAGRVARYLGDISYPLYLWHWPILVLALVTLEREQIGPRAGALVIAVSLVLAALTYHLVEQPVLRHRPTVSGGYRLAALGTTMVLAASAVLHGVATQRTAVSYEPGSPDHPGALALVGVEVPEAETVPALVELGENWFGSDGWECRSVGDFPNRHCDSPADGVPERHLVFVGDSHIGQLVAAFAPVAERENWKLTMMALGACPYSTVSEVDPNFHACREWNEIATEKIVAAQPDAVVTLASRDVRPGRTEVTPPGFVEQWRLLDEAGVPVVAVRDNPRFEHSPSECVERAGQAAPDCGAPRAEIFDPVPPYEALPNVPSNVRFLDLTDAICDAEHCPAEIGNVLVYLDDNHLSTTYLETMAPLAEEGLREAMGW